ncbi:MAG: phosphatidylserine/phosphatidylglycerophosphate/cardiolipin synthase family protein [Bacteroidetes bacterium]|nr:phosphatidylserine/phosphatidylglycerophosphate/cardiolipin synthase family protein [Bacteroidota bacterium]
MQYQLIDDTFKLYNLMLTDIAQAKDYILLETYKFANDHMGKRFRDALTKKAKEGVKVRILIDSWGKGPISEDFFTELIHHNGELKFFEKIKINSDLFTRGHRRDHRKILVIDDAVSYLGSANITGYNLNWRELSLRMEGDMALALKKVFMETYEAFNPYIISNKLNFTRTIYHDNFEIIRDVPSLPLQRIRKKYVQMIRQAKESVVIETPYFLPGYNLRKALTDSSKRNVEVKIIMPRNSDVKMLDILRNKYLGLLHKNNVKIYFYGPYNLHAKMLMIDNSLFSISSANFDYRSFRFQYEIALIGDEQAIIDQLQAHVEETLRSSEAFNYETWEKRSWIEKFFEWLLTPFRHLL